MAALFGHGNPLTTPVGQLIERATDGAQPTENWGLFMEVCDLINETDEGPKDACKAFKKRLSQNVGKNFTAVMYTLTCLETCVKNCGRRFHLNVATKDFLQELVKVLGPKHDPPQTVQEKVLQMIQTWADAFRGVPELKEVEKTYQELKSKGIEFPMTDLDNMAPIHTPARSVPYRPSERLAADPASAPRPPQLQQAAGMPRSAAPTGPPPPVPGMPAAGTPTYPVSLTQEQRTKLSRELEVVQGNVRVMSEMLTELSPSNVDVSDWELLQELNRTCRQMQQRIRELLGEVANEDVTNELLRVNDDLNNVFLRYERFERYVSGQSVPEVTEPSPASDQLPPSYDQLPAQSNPNVGNLIDLDEPTVTSQMAGLNVSNSAAAAPVAGSTSSTGTAGDEDFDMFAQSRQSFDQNRQATGPIYSNQKEDQMTGGLGQAVNVKAQSDQDVLNLQDKDTDYDEMEQWLATHDPNAAAALSSLKDDTEDEVNSGARPEGLTSSEFDRFLMERAAAAETVPTIPAQTGQQPARNTRQLKKEEDDNSLFAL
ncbi:TOM1-like protein 2 isoform X2 [Babylonia areolata]|uniref:TOM1-like protein 2 isoform X2 n=1 Tax=Babylonia areolata TaxID=304850 RepID=UPI003FD2E92F